MTGLADALAPWLAEQRWFAGKNRRIERVEIVHAAEVVDEEGSGGPRGLLLIGAVRFADGGPDHHYQLPLGLRRTLPPWLHTAPIAHHEGRFVYEAAADPELMTALLRRIAAGGAGPGARFRGELPGALRLAARAGLAVRPIAAEQSNTSVVFGDRFILKLFRRIVPGVNPDLEVHRSLSAVPAAPVAPLLGAIEADTALGPVTLGVLQSFVPGAVDGWRLAVGAAQGDGHPVGHSAERPAGHPADGPAAAQNLGPDELADLGATVRLVHGALARAFGTAPLSRPVLDAVRADMLRRLGQAVREVPALGPHAPWLRAQFAALDTVPHGEALQRVHGDLHLGQLLRAAGRWLLIDFEGEPAAPVAERVAWRSPLQDVAGILRSLDYAQAYAEKQAGGVIADPQWAERAKAAFRSGYGGLTPARAALLGVYELDKAVYEAVYEARTRPDWADVPLRALRRSRPAAAAAPTESRVSEGASP
jgi:maltokinase